MKPPPYKLNFYVRDRTSLRDAFIVSSETSLFLLAESRSPEFYIYRERVMDSLCMVILTMLSSCQSNLQYY